MAASRTSLSTRGKTMEAIPTASPNEATVRVGWEVIEVNNQEVTVQIRRIVDSESDGVPTSVETENSMKGVVSSSITKDHYELLGFEKIIVLEQLCTLAIREGKENMIGTPILLEGENLTVSNKNVRFLVKQRDTFTEWMQDMAFFDFDLMYTLLSPRRIRGSTHRLRAGGIEFLRTILDVLPNLPRPKDVAHTILQL
jgi:hypothetical protein